MNFRRLLLQRDALLQKARLANLAFAYDRLGDFAARLARAQIYGQISLRLADPEGERPWPVLVALEGNQSVVDEHFTEEDVVDLADIFAYFRDDKTTAEFTIRLADLEGGFLAGLRRELEAGGVTLNGPASAPAPEAEDSNRERG